MGIPFIRADIDQHDSDPNTHDAFHLVEQDELVSSGTVYPGSTEEVVQVVKWANEYEIPIYPISMGRNRESIRTEIQI